MPYLCSICEEESTRICVRCTKDTCGNHLCDKCFRCSDCCDCEVRLEEHLMVRARTRYAAPPEELPEPHPGPDPDPAPDPEPIPTFPVSG